mmetsp:Transcript_65362/g.155911  ORF Transcript_65362/g.155911 Transcript_65362/m.155911 type:complete len:239 (+) Transcript_65362:286-1002(+)
MSRYGMLFFFRRSMSLLRVMSLVSANDFRDSRRHVILRRVMLEANIAMNSSRQLSPHRDFCCDIRFTSTTEVLAARPRARAVAPSLLTQFFWRSMKVMTELALSTSARVSHSRSPIPQFSRRTSLTWVLLFSASVSCVVYSETLHCIAALLDMSTTVREGSFSFTRFNVSRKEGGRFCMKPPARFGAGAPCDAISPRRSAETWGTEKLRAPATDGEPPDACSNILSLSLRDMHCCPPA